MTNGRVRFILRFARHVANPLGFAIAEQRSKSLGVYRPRHGRLKIHVRHGSGDLFILEEIFGKRLYEPPPEVTKALGDGGPGSVLDLGAHVGMFAVDALSRWPETRIESFEPDPSNFAVLQRTVGINDTRERWSIHNAAVGAADGVVRFAALADSVSHVVDDSAEGTPVPMVDALPLITKADLVKMDVEGSEWGMLEDPRFASGHTRALVLEYHANEAHPRPRGQAITLLRAAGYETQDIPIGDEDVGMLWAWRP